MLYVLIGHGVLISVLILQVFAAPALATPSTFRIPLTTSDTESRAKRGPYFSSDIARLARRITKQEGLNSSSFSDIQGIRTGLIERATSSKIPLNPGRTYYGRIQFGRLAPKTLPVVFDTGHHESWVVGPDCKLPNCLRHGSYDVRRNSAKNNGVRAFINYATGQISGPKYKADSVNLGDLKVPDLLLYVADSLSDQFRKQIYTADGTIGLGLSEDPESFIEVLKKKQLLKQPLFSVKLSNDPQGSEIFFGDTDDSLYEQPMTYFDVVPNTNKWQIPIASISVNDEVAITNAGNALIDTGANVVFGGVTPVLKLLGHLPSVKAAQYDDYVEFYLPCDAEDYVTIAFGAKVFRYRLQIPGEAATDPDTGRAFCLAGMVGMIHMEDDDWVVGQTVLRNLYSVYKFGTTGQQPQIGLARLKGR